MRFTINSNNPKMIKAGTQVFGLLNDNAFRTALKNHNGMAKIIGSDVTGFELEEIIGAFMRRDETVALEIYNPWFPWSKLTKLKRKDPMVIYVKHSLCYESVQEIAGAMAYGIIESMNKQHPMELAGCELVIAKRIKAILNVRFK